jgi:oligoribonuclease
MPESRSKHPLVWIDCEMTGLDLEKDTVMSLCCFVTDAQLNLLDTTGYEAVIHHSKDQLDAMGAWCTEHHAKSGLTAECLSSTKDAQTAAAELLEYIQKFCPERKKALLAGNTVHADRAFLVQQPYTPVIKWLHHRILDVSAIKEAAKRWAPIDIIKKSPSKQGKHEARADILESIEEARYYRRVFFQNGAEPNEESAKPTVQSLQAEGFGATSSHQQDSNSNGGDRDLAS